MMVVPKAVVCTKTALPVVERDRKPMGLDGAYICCHVLVLNVPQYADMSKDKENGKGSKKRKAQVPRKIFEKNWDRIFKKPKGKYHGMVEWDQRGWEPK
jgi:hypothetical protein